MYQMFLCSSFPFYLFLPFFQYKQSFIIYTSAYYQLHTSWSQPQSFHCRLTRIYIDWFSHMVGNLQYWVGILIFPSQYSVSTNFRLELIEPSIREVSLSSKKTIKKKRIFFFLFWSLSWSKACFLFSYFLDFFDKFLGRKRVFCFLTFLISLINSHLCSGPGIYKRKKESKKRKHALVQEKKNLFKKIKIR